MFATRANGAAHPATGENPSAKTRTRIIDCDVHHQFDDVKGNATYEDAIGCLPSVANMWQQNVIDFARASENRTAQKAKRAENACHRASPLGGVPS